MLTVSTEARAALATTTKAGVVLEVVVVVVIVRHAEGLRLSRSSEV